MVDSRQHRRQRSVNVSGTKAASIYPWSQLGHRRNWKLKWRRSHVVLRVKIWLLGPCPGTRKRMVKHGSAHFCCKSNMIRHVGTFPTILYIYIYIHYYSFPIINQSHHCYVMLFQHRETQIRRRWKNNFNLKNKQIKDFSFT